MLRGFYAHGDTRTPFVINLFENLINIVLAVAMYRSFGVMGLALSFAIAYLVSATWALKVLSYKVPGFPVRATLRKLAPMVLAAVVMAEVMWVVARLVGSNAGIGAVVRVVFAGVVGLAAYVGLLAVLGVSEVNQVRARLSGRLRRPAAPSA